MFRSFFFKGCVFSAISLNAYASDEFIHPPPLVRSQAFYVVGLSLIEYLVVIENDQVQPDRIYFQRSRVPSPRSVHIQEIPIEDLPRMADHLERSPNTTDTPPASPVLQLYDRPYRSSNPPSPPALEPAVTHFDESAYDLSGRELSIIEHPLPVEAEPIATQRCGKCTCTIL